MVSSKSSKVTRYYKEIQSYLWWQKLREDWPSEGAIFAWGWRTQIGGHSEKEATQARIEGLQKCPPSKYC